MWKILFNLSSNANHEGHRFSKTLVKKSFEFISSRRDSTITLNLRLVLILIKVDPISKEQNYKKNILETRGTGHIEMVLILLTEVVALYMGATIVQVEVPSPHLY